MKNVVKSCTVKMCSPKQICNVAPAMFRETSQGGELDNLTSLYVKKLARKEKKRGKKDLGEFCVEM